jgi:hypothetical protein
MSTVRTNTVSRIRTPNRRPLHHPVIVPRRPDIPGVAVEACSAASTTVDRGPADTVATRGAHPVASNQRADDPVAALLRSAALFWGHDLLTHPFLHFDTNFLHPAARIRAFSSCSWTGKKFSVIEANFCVFLGGWIWELPWEEISFRTRDSPSSGRQASVFFPLLLLLQDLFRFSIRFDFFFSSSQKWEVIVWWFWSLQMRLEDREQTLGFDVARRREFRCGFLFFVCFAG